MFYALAKGKIPTNGFEIEHVIQDIETLNRWALGVGAGFPARGGAGKPAPTLEATALSCHAFGLLTDRYDLLPYGASVGDGYGPVVVAKRQMEIRGSRVAVPGRYTTAFLVLQLYEPDFQPIFTPFDKIPERVKKGEVDFGLLIHEGQLTYQESGLQKVVDLGEWWADKFQFPLPLGINAIRRDLAHEIKVGFTQIFKKSIDYAMGHRVEAMRYALEFGRGIDTAKGDRFVGMYVNHYSLDLGEKGMRALEFLYELGWKKSLLPARVELTPFTAGG